MTMSAANTAVIVPEFRSTVIISSSPNDMRRALEGSGVTATVEAEYGDVVIEGSDYTLAHHGERSGNPCPCLMENLKSREEQEQLEKQNPLWACADEFDVIGMSHFDLDALGGVLALLGLKPEVEEGFWEVAAFVDTHGPHRMEESDHLDPYVEIKMFAYWAFSETHRVFPPRNGDALDIRDEVQEHLDALRRIEANDPELLEAGAAWYQAKQQLESDSFRQALGVVLLRESAQFCNHLYRHGNRPLDKGVVTFNPERRSVTLSLESPISGVSCREIAQKLWGPEAGGHDGIAGSPRDVVMDRQEALRAALHLNDAINEELDLFPWCEATGSPCAAGIRFSQCGRPDDATECFMACSFQMGAWLPPETKLDW